MVPPAVPADGQTVASLEKTGIAKVSDHPVTRVGIACTRIPDGLSAEAGLYETFEILRQDAQDAPAKQQCINRVGAGAEKPQRDGVGGM